MQNLIFKGLNGKFKIAAATQYITRIKDSTKKYSIIQSKTEELPQVQMPQFSHITYLSPQARSRTYLEGMWSDGNTE